MFPTMNATYEQFAHVQKANMEAFKTMTQAALIGTERLNSLNIEAARGLLEAGFGNASILLDAKTLQNPVGIQRRMAAPDYERIAAYSRGLYEIASEVHKMTSTVMAERIAETSSKATSAMEEVASAAGIAAKSRKAA